MSEPWPPHLWIVVVVMFQEVGVSVDQGHTFYHLRCHRPQETWAAFAWWVLWVLTLVSSRFQHVVFPLFPKMERTSEFSNSGHSLKSKRALVGRIFPSGSYCIWSLKTDSEACLSSWRGDHVGSVPCIVCTDVGTVCPPFSRTRKTYVCSGLHRLPSWNLPAFFLVNLPFAHCLDVLLKLIFN